MQKLSPLDTRIPLWDLNGLEERACPLCQSQPGDALYQRPDNLLIRFCSSCGTYFVSPAPSERELAALYASYDRGHSRNERMTAKEIRDFLDRMSPFDDLRIREIASLLPVRGARILDVGFGRAGFLYHLKRLGAAVYGVDPDGEAHVHAHALGIESTFTGGLEAVDASLRFDVVVMNDLIEHPLDPMRLIRQGADLLADGGYLLLWTPNGGAIQSNPDPVTLRIDLEHLQYFSTESILSLSQRTGLHPVHLETVGFVDEQHLAGQLRTLKAQADGSSTAHPSFRKLLRRIPGFESANTLRRAVQLARRGATERAQTPETDSARSIFSAS